MSCKTSSRSVRSKGGSLYSPTVYIHCQSPTAKDYVRTACSCMHNELQYVGVYCSMCCGGAVNHCTMVFAFTLLVCGMYSLPESTAVAKPRLPICLATQQCTAVFLSFIRSQGHPEKMFIAKGTSWQDASPIG